MAYACAITVLNGSFSHMQVLYFTIGYPEWCCFECIDWQE